MACLKVRQVCILRPFEANYHVAEVIAVAFGNEKDVFVTDLDTAVASEAFKKWLSDASVEKHLFDTKAAKYWLTASAST